VLGVSPLPPHGDTLTVASPGAIVEAANPGEGVVPNATGNQAPAQSGRDELYLIVCPCNTTVISTLYQHQKKNPKKIQ
jgi:hypothetical protein